MSVKVVDRLPIFKQHLYSALDDALQESARDTLIKARTRAPFLKGPLRANSQFTRVKLHHQRVSFWMEYARYQEFGGDGTKRVRNYSTPGTGAHYLRDAGDAAVKSFSRTLRKHAGRARA